MSAPIRDTQLSLVEGMDRPVGRIPLSVQTGTNADLIATIAPNYLTGSVLDVTYGEGKWWDRFTPDPFTFHDLYKVDGVDFTALPEADASVDTVCFDPPYVHSGGEAKSATADEFRARFGLIANAPTGSFYDLILDGLAEACRVARHFVLVKCMEFAQGDGMNRTGFHDVPTLVTNAAAAHGWFVTDRIVHFAGTGPGGHNITTIKRTRRAHSYLIVFTKSSEAAALPSPASDLDGGAFPPTTGSAASAGPVCGQTAAAPAIESRSTNQGEKP